MYLAIDPGKNTGWARFDEEGNFAGFGEVKGEDAFLDWLEDQENVTTYIVEQYRSRPGAINAWSTGDVQQLIGAVKRVAKKRGITVVMQDPSPALSIGLRFIGLHTQYRGKHVPDKVSAFAHGTYYLRKAGISK